MDPQFRPDVMLLAAGLGTRLRPLTAHMPKPLVPVAGVALIDRVLAAARAEGLTRFVVNVHHHAALLEAHLAGDPAITISREDAAPLGTGGGVRQALPLLTTDPILTMNTDAFWLPGADRPITRMLERYAEGGAPIVLLCVHPRDARGFRRSHDFCLDPSGRITRDTGAPVIYAGVALAERSLFAGKAGEAFSSNDIIAALTDRGEANGVVLDAAWLHVGDPDAVAEAEAAL